MSLGNARSLNSEIRGQSVDHTRMRELNLALILGCLRDFSPISRTQLSELTGLTKATVTTLVKMLIDQRFVREVGVGSKEVGRPSINLELNPDAGYLIGAEMGVDFIALVLSDFSARIIWRQYESLPAGMAQGEIIATVVEMIRKAVKRAEQDHMRVLGMGLGIPGLVDIEHGMLLFAPNLGWRDVPLQKMLQDNFNFPILVDNEANLAALGESYHGAGRKSNFVLYVSAGVGIGGGMVINKQILQGSTGFAGEIGHMTMDPDGLPCNCGNVGCFETLASQWSVFRRIRMAVESGQETSLLAQTDGDLSGLTVELVVKAAQEGDGVALAALRETGRYLGIGIASLVNALNPELVIFGGILTSANEFLLPEIRAEIQRRALKWSWNDEHLVTAAYGADACVIGGCAAVYHNILSQPLPQHL